MALRRRKGVYERFINKNGNSICRQQSVLFDDSMQEYSASQVSIIRHMFTYTIYWLIIIVG